MSNELQMTQDFQSRIFAKIRESIGDLMTDEDLKKLVAASMQKALFEGVRIHNPYGQDKVEEPRIVKLVEELLRDQVRVAVKAWLEANPDAVTKAIKESIEKGVFGMVQSYIDSKTSWPLQELANKLQQNGVLR